MWTFLVLIIHVGCISYSSQQDWHGNYEKTFPGRIPGPKKLTDSIGIIGAGPSGIHMAYLLKKKGFKNITILEASNQIGGKSTTLRHRGAIHEMGTCYLSADYEHNVLPLVRKFTNDTTKPPPIASVWSSLTPNSSMPFNRLYAVILKRKNPNLNMTEIHGKFVQLLTKYVYLHKTLFGDYYGEIMPEPSEQTMEKIQGTFLEFLTRNGLEDLEELFTAAYTLQGYGRVRHIPAFYGLLWNTPKVVQSLVELAQGKPGAIYMLQNGFQNLWEKMAYQLDLKITFNTKILHVYLWRGKAYVYSKSTVPRHSVQRQKFDFLIWSPPANDLMRIIYAGEQFDFLRRERKMFSGMTNSYYTTSLVDDVGAKRGESAVNWWIDNIKYGIEASVWANRDSYTMFNDLNGREYRDAMTLTGNDANRDLRTSVFYQYSMEMKRKKNELEAILRNHLRKMGATEVRIIKQFRWKYFTRFTGKQITEEKRIWRVMERQGKNNMWFIGASVCFESVKSVVEYNQLLVSMIEPQREE